MTGGGGVVVAGAELDTSLQTPAEVHVLYGLCLQTVPAGKFD